MARGYLEDNVEVVRIYGLNTGKNAVLGGTLAVTGVATFTAAPVFSGGLGSSGAFTVTSASANALAVGLNGTTNPALQIDASTASSATGLKVKSAAATGAVALSVISSGTNEGMTIDAKGSGTVIFQGTATGRMAMRTGITIGGGAGLSDANALAVGQGGTTNPAFNVDTTTVSSATGLNVKSAAAASGLAVSVISSGTNENLTIDAKGSGTITLNATGTGNIVLSRAATGVSASVTGALTARSATATPAAASAVAALLFSSTSALGVYWGTGSPNTALTAAQGSLYTRTDGSSTSTRLYVNTDGSTGWTNITTAA